MGILTHGKTEKKCLFQAADLDLMPCILQRKICMAHSQVLFFPWEFFLILQYGKIPMGFFDFLKLLISEKIIMKKKIQWTYNFNIMVKLYLYFNIYIFRGKFFPWEIFSIFNSPRFILQHLFFANFTCVSSLLRQFKPLKNITLGRRH